MLWFFFQWVSQHLLVHLCKQRLPLHSIAACSDLAFFYHIHAFQVQNWLKIYAVIDYINGANNRFKKPKWNKT